MPKLVCGLVDHVIDDAFVEFRRSGQLDLGGLKPFGLLLRGFGATADQTTFQFFEDGGSMNTVSTSRPSSSRAV